MVGVQQEIKPDPQRLVSPDLGMPHRAKIEWAPDIYAYIDRCRIAAIKQRSPARKWITFLRQGIYAKGLPGLHMLGDIYFGVKPEGQE